MVWCPFKWSRDGADYYIEKWPGRGHNYRVAKTRYMKTCTFTFTVELFLEDAM